MESAFKDHFSKHAKTYSDFRPTYPEKLFDYIVSLLSKKNLAWDCATGNGQAALALSEKFAKVIATDGSKDQIDNAIHKKNIEYRVAFAEASGLKKESVDLLTVAQALHWFNFDDFFKEADRVLKHKGVLAVWSYGLFNISPEIDNIVLKLYSNTLKDFWPPERKHVEEKYQSINFPYAPIITPSFFMEKTWSPEQIQGYLSSWSSVQKFIGANGYNPVQELSSELNKYLNSTNTVKWPLNLKVCIKP